MGCICSKCPSGSQTQAPGDSNLPATFDLSYYLAGVRVDPELQVVDSSLHGRASRVIDSVAHGVHGRSLPFNSVRDATGSITDFNHEIVKVILQSKKDIWRNNDLLSLVNEYFEYSEQISGPIAALDNCLKRARNRQLLIRAALLRYEEESKNGIEGNDGGRYVKTLQELRNFKEAGDLFTEEFFTLFQAVYEQQLQMFQKLLLKKHDLHTKLKQCKVYRKVANIIFAAIFLAVIVCSVVAVAVAAPAWVAALAAAASGPAGGVGNWFNSLFMKFENALKDQKELVTLMGGFTNINIEDLGTIACLIDKLEIRIQELLSNADFVLGQDEAVKIMIDEITKKMSNFTELIDDLTTRTEKYSRDLTTMKMVVLRRIMRDPGSSTSSSRQVSSFPGSL
ncbi:hypothetical protein Nepgr_027091 [Nepenthes gracilis]|uniref:Uncharacterized protein n=1 Tax=Nepenthes gracilis TaxID=150966 RepID=A0AAD3T8C7_NEPGR|nr:hypothetical protein Nepgr_027091 [Nepenthes gracilis]